MQSENLIIVFLLAMDWVEVVASVVMIINVLNLVGDWGAMLIIEFYVSRFFSCAVTDFFDILLLLRFNL